MYLNFILLVGDQSDIPRAEENGHSHISDYSVGPESIINNPMYSHFPAGLVLLQLTTEINILKIV